MPLVADTGKTPTDPVGELLAKFACPLPHGFVADNDAAGGQQLLHHAKTEREAEIQPHRMTDDLGREPMPGVASASGCRHPIRLLTPIRRRKYPRVHQVDGALTRPNRYRDEADGGMSGASSRASREYRPGRTPPPNRRVPSQRGDSADTLLRE